MQDFASALCVFVSTITYAQTCDGIKFDVFIIIMKLLVCMCACVHVYWEVLRSHLCGPQKLKQHFSPSSKL